ncbi:MAG: prolipoprotein diacylglyceryl transferase [Verrucomicrobiales bacterium]|nr:prolipoprotein diacylglyceryl transferase [Verrucomicrobiales bacterium]
MTDLLATYIHHLDPFAIQFTESFGIRWYGLAYVAGFLAAFLVIRWYVKLGLSELRKDQVADFITVVAIFGVMLGGRLGFMLLYDWDEFIHNPAIFFNFMGGGMASHGGFAGVAIAIWVYARVTKKSWTGLGDNIVSVAPLGIFFGRMANFVNGELYGRKTDHAWAMKFPDELNETQQTAHGFEWAFSSSQLRELAAKAGEVAPGLAERVESAAAAVAANGYDPHGAIVRTVIEESNRNPAFREMLGEILNPRHPSQLYEGLVEGLFLFLLLLFVRLKWRKLYHGILTGLFFIIYAIGRIVVENVREPDAEQIMGFTRGQFYSFFMIVVGIAFLAYGMIAKRQTKLPEPAEKKS